MPKEVTTSFTLKPRSFEILENFAIFFVAVFFLAGDNFFVDFFVGDFLALVVEVFLTIVFFVTFTGYFLDFAGEFDLSTAVI